MESDLKARLADWSAAYPRSVFGVAPPAEPAADADIIYAVLVVLPEAVALAVLVLDGATWRTRRLVAFALIGASGLIALIGILSLTLAEVAGARWSAATRREVVAVPVNASTIPALQAVEGHSESFFFTGLLTMRLETFVQVVRNGYRVRLLVGVCVALCVSYTVLSVALLGVVTRRRLMAASDTPRRRIFRLMCFLGGARRPPTVGDQGGGHAGEEAALVGKLEP